jgi:hypothetical protein
MRPGHENRGMTTVLALTLTVGVLAIPAHATVIRNSISGSMDDSDSNCPSPVPAFNQDDCSYNASNPANRVIVEWIGPLFNAGYYAPGTAPHPDIAGGLEPVPGDGKARPPVVGTVDIDDQGTASGTDDTITASIVIGAAERNFGAGARGTGVESWTSLIIAFGPVTVSSAAANANGGLDYVIGSRGLPPFLVDAATGLDVWPSEDGSESDSAIGFGHYWAGFSPIGIAPIEDNVASGGIATGIASIGTTATLTTTGYNCYDGPPNNGDGIGGAQSVCDAQGRLGGAGNFENIILSLSTDAGGNITVATLIWVQEQDVVVVPAGFDSWVAGVIEFTGTSVSCGASGAGAADDSYTVDHDSAGNILNVGANDTGFQNPTTASICVSPDHGGVVSFENSPGDPLAIAVNYTPAPGFAGSETFQYTMNDGVTIASATVTIDVAHLIARNDTASVIEGASVDIDVTANDSAGAGPMANHTVTITRQPNVGSVVVGAGNMVAYTAPAGSHGNGNFEYTLTDGDGEVSAPATVQVGIGVAREFPPAEGVSSIDPWMLLVLAGILLRRAIGWRRYPLDR